MSATAMSGECPDGFGAADDRVRVVVMQGFWLMFEVNKPSATPISTQPPDFDTGLDVIATPIFSTSS